MFFGGERRLRGRLRRTQDLMGRDEGKIASFVPSHYNPRAPQSNPQSSLTPKTHNDWVRVCNRNRKRALKLAVLMKICFAFTGV